MQTESAWKTVRTLHVLQWVWRRATSNSLKALSHSFCPAACWVQSVMSWLILSVTALKHTHILKLAHVSSSFVSFLLLQLEHAVAGPLTVMDSHSTQEGWVRPEFVFCLVEHRQAWAKASIFLIRHREISQALSPLGLAARLLTGGRRGTPPRQMQLRS